MKNEEYVNIDLFKLIMAICVVAMHINPFAACSNEYIVNLYDVTVRMAVPFFFMSTGFLIAKKGNDYRTAFKRVLKKTARLYCIWSWFIYQLH